MSFFEARQELRNRIDSAKAAGLEHPGNVTVLRPGEISENQLVFQQRRPSAFDSGQHIKNLMAALKNGRPFDPVCVWWAAGHWFVIDGHHRMQAYRRSNWKKLVPVTVFNGSLDEALARTTSENHKNHLRMDKQQQCDAAWRFVCGTGLKWEEIMESTGISRRQVFELQAALRDLSGRNYDLETLSGLKWKEARSLWKNEPQEKSFDDAVEAEARAMVGKLQRMTASPLQKAAISRALEMLDPSLPHRLAVEWIDHIPPETLTEEVKRYIGLDDLQREARDEFETTLIDAVNLDLKVRGIDYEYKPDF